MVVKIDFSALFMKFFFRSLCFFSLESSYADSQLKFIKTIMLTYVKCSFCQKKIFINKFFIVINYWIYCEIVSVWYILCGWMNLIKIYYKFKIWVEFIEIVITNNKEEAIVCISVCGSTHKESVSRNESCLLYIFSESMIFIFYYTTKWMEINFTI